MAICSEEHTRQVIQDRARQHRDHMQKTGGKVPSQEQAEKKQQEICRAQDKRHEEKRK